MKLNNLLVVVWWVFSARMVRLIVDLKRSEKDHCKDIHVFFKFFCFVIWVNIWFSQGLLHLVYLRRFSYQFFRKPLVCQGYILYLELGIGCIYLCSIFVNSNFLILILSLVNLSSVKVFSERMTHLYLKTSSTNQFLFSHT